MEVKLALDTNRYGDFCLGDAAVVAALESAEEVFLPFVVLGELRAGSSRRLMRAGLPGASLHPRVE